MIKTKIYILFVIGILAFPVSSCTSQRYGCPGENAGIKMDKNGNLPTRRGKSQLFNKPTRKRIKTHKRK